MKQRTLDELFDSILEPCLKRDLDAAYVIERVLQEFPSSEAGTRRLIETLKSAKDMAAACHGVVSMPVNLFDAIVKVAEVAAILNTYKSKTDICDL